jgi:hypothetical protein
MESIEIAQLIASLATAVTVLFLVYQIRLQTVSTNNQIYQNFVSNSLEIDKALIAHPELRKYIYGNEPIDPDKVDVNLLLSVEELVVDVVENVKIFEKQIPHDNLIGWKNFIRRVESSSGFDYFMDACGHWYDTERGTFNAESGGTQPAAGIS